MRLINADALCGKQEEMYIHTESGKIIPAMAVPVWAINNAPVIDAEPVRLGRWDDSILPFCNVCMGCGCVVDRTSCFPTVMRAGVVQPRIGKLNYCPNCGAKMDGGNEDATD